MIISVTSPDEVTASMLAGATNAVSLSLKMLAIYAVWTSVLKLMEKTGIDKNSRNFAVRLPVVFSETKAKKRSI